METINKSQQTLAFINDKSPIVDIICNDLINLGFDILYRSETIANGLEQLSTLKSVPKVCIIDLDFYDKKILDQLQKLRSEYPNIRFIAHSDIDNEKVGKAILNIGFSSYLLIGSDVSNFIEAIDRAGLPMTENI